MNEDFFARLEADKAKRKRITTPAMRRPKSWKSCRS